VTYTSHIEMKSDQCRLVDELIQNTPDRDVERSGASLKTSRYRFASRRTRLGCVAPSTRTGVAKRFRSRHGLDHDFDAFVR